MQDGEEKEKKSMTVLKGNVVVFRFEKGFLSSAKALGIGRPSAREERFGVNLFSPCERRKSA
jgi:hypothetical protein